jgi:hypothetical protein
MTMAADRAAAYLRAVADELLRRGVTVRSVDVRQDQPDGGRLVVEGRAGHTSAGRLILVWLAGAGWSAVWPAQPGTWPYVIRGFVDEPDTAPAVIACLVSDILTV